MCACLMSEDGSYYYVTLCTLCSSFFENVVEEESSRVSGKIIWRERKGERERERKRERLLGSRFALLSLYNFNFRLCDFSGNDFATLY